MSVLVLGGSGFIGGRVVEWLTANKHQALSCDIIQSNAQGKSVKWVKADVLEPLSLERLFLEYEVKSVIHLIGLPVIVQCEKNPQISFQLNVLSLQNSLEAMRRVDVEKVVFASSAAVYGYSLERPVMETDDLMPNTIYGYHKVIGEELLKSYTKSYGMKHIALRLFNVYGSDPFIGKDIVSILIKGALNKETVTLKGRNKFRDFIHIDDVARIFCDLVFSNISDRVINVGTGKKVKLEEVANMAKSFCPEINVVEQETADDGTGLVADVTQLTSMIHFHPIDPIKGIRNYMKSYLARAGKKRR